jgi:hypothetical protein
MTTRTLDDTSTEASAGTSSGTSSEDEEYYRPPCRSAALAIVPCPLCGRQVTAKTLRYSHRCGRSFYLEEREEEHRKLAEIAVLSRMGQAKKQPMVPKPPQAQPIEHRMEPRSSQAHPVGHPTEHLLENTPANPNKYAQLFKNAFGVM